MIELIRDEDEDVRRAAIEILNQTKDERAINFLIEATKDKDWWVSERAVDALAEIGSKKAVPALLDLLNSDNTRSLPDRRSRARQDRRPPRDRTAGEPARSSGKGNQGRGDRCAGPTGRRQARGHHSRLHPKCGLSTPRTTRFSMRPCARSKTSTVASRARRSPRRPKP